MRLNTFFIIVIISISLGTLKLRQINKETREFVNITMLGLFADWNNSEFLTYTSNGFQQNLTSEQLFKINLIFQVLGNLLNYHGAQGGVSRWDISVRYKVHASFQNGQFTAIITLIKQQQKWAISRFEYRYAFFPNRRHSGSLQMV